MKRTTRLSAFLLLCAVQMVAACASLGEQQSPPYQVGVGSAIYAGSSTPTEKTKVGVDLYFGHYVIEGGGDGRGCCYSTGMAGGNSGRPRGAVLAIWSASVYGDDRYYSEEYREWLTKRTDKKFYYAVSQPSELAPYPPKAKNHRSYGIYVSAGKVVVSEKGLRSVDAVDAIKFTPKAGKPPKYAFGRDDTLYYKIISHGSDVPSVADDTSPWNTIAGVAITEAQYFELLRCSPGRNCRWFLSPADSDLTPEQLEYVRRHPLRPEDMKPLIKILDRSRRQSARWA